MSPFPARADVEQFREWIDRRLGLHFEDGRLKDLSEVLRRRMTETGCDSFAAYLPRLREPDPEEAPALARMLTVTETYFFRNPDQFRAFAEVVLPDRVRTLTPGRKLRLLSAGCASGEEPYTLAILTRGQVPEAANLVEIRAMDLNPAMLDKARAARYGYWALRDTPGDARSNCFRVHGREFVLAPAIRDMVTLEQRNLLDPDPDFWREGSFDVVFCRNVLMYFSPEAARAAVERITRALVPGGFLFLGHAETLRGLSQDFHLRHTHETFYYQRKDGAISPLAPEPLPKTSRREPARPAADEPTAQAEPWMEAIQRASDRISKLTAKTPAGGGGEGTPARPWRQDVGNGLADERRASQDGTQPPRPEGAGGLPSGESDRLGRGAVTEPPPPAGVAGGKGVPPTGANAASLSIPLELLRQERFADALAELERSSPGNGADPDTLLLRAALHTQVGDLSGAERTCAQVLAADELNAGAHYLMALCREQAGDRGAAADFDRAASYLDPDFAMPHLHLGLLARRAGDLDAARRELKQAQVLLGREDASRILLFGGGFHREALVTLCGRELLACGGEA